MHMTTKRSIYYNQKRKIVNVGYVRYVLNGSAFFVRGSVFVRLECEERYICTREIVQIIIYNFVLHYYPP